MSPLEQLRTRLREVLDRSAAARFLRESKGLWADAWTRGLPPSTDEIQTLSRQGNSCPDWDSLRLTGAGSLENIRNCRFEGNVILGFENGAPRLENSRIRDSWIGATSVHDVKLLQRVRIEDGASLRNLGTVSGSPGSRFCLGTPLHPGSETRARRVFLIDGLSMEDCTALAALVPADQETLTVELASLLDGLSSDYAFVGAKARLENTGAVENCFLGPGATVAGAASLRNSILASTLEDPAHAGNGVVIADSILDPGAGVGSLGQVRRSLLLGYSSVKRAGQAEHAVLGANTEVAKGEVTASLVGPFVGFHHQALLIGALWPEGRGNVGYGANVGSNHTGRKPDQEIRPGEGTFFGLGCSIKFPANFEAAPYSLFATGVVAAPQRLAFPFSLITPPSNAPAGTAGLNEIAPGWMWGENAYALVRNAYKYSDRDKTRRPSAPGNSPLEGTFLASDLFAPRIVECVRAAAAALAGVSASKPTDACTEKDIAGLGKNFLRAGGLDKARAAYTGYLAFACFRSVLGGDASGKPSAEAAALWKASGLKDAADGEARLDAFYRSVTASLEKDAKRGTEIFTDYADFHPGPEQDPVCARLRADLERLRAPLRARLAAFRPQ